MTDHRPSLAYILRKEMWRPLLIHTLIHHVPLLMVIFVVVSMGRTWSWVDFVLLMVGIPFLSITSTLIIAFYMLHWLKKKDRWARFKSMDASDQAGLITTGTNFTMDYAESSERP